MLFDAEELHAAMHLMHAHGSYYGYPPGSFHELLIRAMMHADHINLAKLLLAFPEYRRPVNILTHGGLSELEEIAANSSIALKEAAEQA